ncbi:MAG: tetratricopeptide repeat protein [Deltaproteobacteria bacterium]|nr:tetratricopeptide repeat protein [Deltaproteobacteria bacterium]
MSWLIRGPWGLLGGAILSLGLAAGCQPHATGIGAGLPQSYYFFLKAHYDEFSHRDDEAVNAMKRAAAAAGGPYYLELETARMLARKGRVEESTLYVNKAMALSPQDPEPRLFAGYLASIAGQWDEAEKNYLEALRLDPLSDEAISYLGAMYAESGRLDEASDAFRKLRAMAPTSYLPDYFLGRVALRRNRPQEAIRFFENSVRKNPDFVESLVELALLHEQMGNLRAAEKDYRRIIASQPDMTMAKARLSRVLLKVGKRAEAVRLIDEIAGLNQNTEEAGITIGLMFLEEGLHQKAMAEFSAVLRKNPGNDQARYLLAVTQAENGDEKGARANLMKISPVSSEYVDGILYLTSILVREERRAEALDILSVARSQARDSSLLVATGRILEEMGRALEARDLYLEGLKLFPKGADVYFSLGAAEDKLGNKELCVAAMETAIELDPEFAEALNYLAYTWAEENAHLQEALALALKANALKPDNGYYLDTLAWVYYRLGDLKKALPLLERAARLSQEDPVIVEHLGDVLLKLGRGPEARRAFARALEVGHESPESVRDKLNAIQNP